MEGPSVDAIERIEQMMEERFKVFEEKMMYAIEGIEQMMEERFKVIEEKMMALMTSFGGGRGTSPEVPPPKATPPVADEVGLNIKFYKFNGLGDPAVHLRNYAMTMRIAKMKNHQLAAYFPLSLADAASNWYARLDQTTARNWSMLREEFLKQFALDTQLKVTLDNLRGVKRKQGESSTKCARRSRSNKVNHGRGRGSPNAIPEEEGETVPFVPGAL